MRSGEGGEGGSERGFVRKRTAGMKIQEVRMGGWRGRKERDEEREGGGKE